MLQKQFDVLGSLLVDPCPQVRESTISSTCRILSTFWELIPAKTTAAMLSSMVNELIHDKSSPNVRAAVFEGLSLILENPLSQESLKKVLPSLGNMIHDKSQKVRGAVVSLLVRVKSVRSIKFYDIVPVNHLLQCLTNDERLASSLVELLLDSFYPQGLQGAEQLKRAMSLVRADSTAALAFCTHLHNCVSVGSVCKLSMLLGKWIDAEMKRSKKPTAERLKDMKTALKSINILWTSIADELERPMHVPAKEKMESVFSFETFIRPLMDIVYKKTTFVSLKGPVVEIAGILECDNVLLEIIMDEFQGRKSDDGFEDLGPGMRCLTLWEKEEELLELVISKFCYVLFVISL